MTYLLQLQKAIHDTAEQSSVDMAHRLPSGPTRDWWIGWEECEKDLDYGMTLGETCVGGHLQIWTADVVESREDSGYLARINAIKKLMEGV